MIKIAIQAEDFEGQVITEEVSFHINKVELTEMNLKYEGGLEAEMKRIQETGDAEKMFNFLKEMMIASFGVRSENGKAFIKDPKLTEEFRYGYLLPECLVAVMKDETGKGMFNFFRGIMPVSTQKAIMEQAKTVPAMQQFMN